MSTKEVDKELRRLLTKLFNGTREECRAAKKEINRLYHADSEGLKKAAPLVFKYMEQFDGIEGSRNQEAFISGLSIFFLVLADDHFERLADFTLRLIQHSNGHVREAVRKTADWLYVSLTGRMRPFRLKKNGLSPDNRESQEIARRQFWNYLEGIEALLARYAGQKDTERTEYIEEMKPSVYKSLQQLWHRVSYGAQLAVADPSKEIADRRKEVEADLLDLIKKTGADCTVWDVLQMVYDEQNQSDMHGILRLFDNGDQQVLAEALETVSDAWNYFPHRMLNGLSPQEVSKHQKHQDEQT